MQKSQQWQRKVVIRCFKQTIFIHWDIYKACSNLELVMYWAMPQRRDNSEPPPLTIPAIFPGMPQFPAFPGASHADPQPMGNVPGYQE